MVSQRISNNVVTNRTWWWVILIVEETGADFMNKRFVSRITPLHVTRKVFSVLYVMLETNLLNPIYSSGRLTFFFIKQKRLM